MLGQMPEVGKTYIPDSSIVQVSDGLPRTISYVATRPGTERYVVHFTTIEGDGYQSDNLWQRWISETGATAR